MKSGNFKNALLGIILANIAAYMFPTVLIIVLEWPRGFQVLYSPLPLFALFYVSWIVIPLGAALGMLIPQVASGKARWTAALQGTGIGALAGLVSLLTDASVFGVYRMMTGVLVLSAMVYSALWVGAYAFYCANGQSIYR